MVTFLPALGLCKCDAKQDSVGTTLHFTQVYGQIQPHDRVTMKTAFCAIALLVAGATHARTICPNGQVVEGTVCVLLPNGSYVAGQTGVQPSARVQHPRPITEPARVDSTPFNNQLQSPLDMVPSPVEPRRDNSRHRSDNQQFTQCPDGSTVPGRYCVMTSNGRYIGRY